MKIIVDTNIIFSGLLNTNSMIGELLIHSKYPFEFYGCNFMRFEIQNHKEKIMKIAKFTDQQFSETQQYLFSRLSFVSEVLIPASVWKQAYQLTKNVDIDDIDFVALTLYLDGFLWTGDKMLYNGLKENGFENVINTSELFQLK